MAFSATTKKSAFMKECLTAVFCLPHCSWSTLKTSLPLYQRGSQIHYMQTTCQSGMHLSTPPLQLTGSEKPLVVSTSGHWTGALRSMSAKQQNVSTLFSLSTSKEQMKLWLKDEIVPQTDTPTFLGVKMDTPLTWNPKTQKMERSSLQKLALMRKLAGTTCGANSSILTKVYTATVPLTMDYASTAWGTGAKTNKNRLDKVQNMDLQVILGAMKTTPVYVMETNSQCRDT